MRRYPYKICHLLLGSIFILVSSINFPDTANAEPPVLDVTAESSCIVEKIESNGNGKLAVTNDNKALSSSIPGGKSGLITIDCNGSATVEISKPSQKSGTTTFLESDILSATANNAELNIANPGTFSQPIIDSEGDGYFGEVQVNMEARKNSGLISPGEYSFTVTLTVTPTN
jgi:hypothetical protein